MKKFLLLVVAVASVISVIHGFDLRTDGSLAEEALVWAKKNPDAAEAALHDVFPEKVHKGRDEFITKLRDDTSQGCTICKLIFNILSNSIQGNTSWADMENGMIQACERLINITGANGNIICPGTIRLQGPHVFTILKERNNTDMGLRFCELLNVCAAEPEPLMPAPKFDAVASFKSLQAQMAARMKRNKRKSKNKLKIIQIADVHIDVHYKENSATECPVFICCREKYNGAGSAGMYGSYSCNVPVRTMELLISKIKEMNPDLVIYSGDAPPHTMWEETYESQLNCSGRVVEAFNRIMPGVEVYPNIGNHEMYPTNLYYLPLDETRNMNDMFASWYDEYLTPDNVATMRYAGYYSKLIRPGLRLLSFNTNFMYSMNFYNVRNIHRPEFAEMKRFMTETFQTARTNGEKVLVVGHHPPGNGDGLLNPNRWLRKLLSDYADQVVLHVAGHTHRDEFKVVTDPVTKQPKTVVFVAPSANSLSNINPSLRVFTLDANTFELENYEQHHLDLRKSLLTGNEPNLTLSYTAKDEYGLRDMSPHSFYQLAHRLAFENDTLLRYHANLQARSALNPTCNANCRENHFCYTTSVVFDDYNECRATALPTGLPPTTATTITTTTVGAASKGIGLWNGGAMVWVVVLALMMRMC